MSDEGPKLFTNKPKKSKLKASTPINTTSSSSMEAAAPPPPRPPPPPPPPQDSFIRRYKFFGKLVLGFSFITGAYVLLRTTMQDKGTSEEETRKRPTSSTSTSTAPAPLSAPENPVSPPIVEPIQRAPIPEDQQRELFKWMLEEKRKVKARDAEEKRHIDEEKSILKQFIRTKSLPSI